MSSIIYPPSYQGLAASSPAKHAAAYGAPMVAQHIPQAAVPAPPAMQIQQPYVPASSNMLVSVDMKKMTILQDTRYWSG